MTRRPSRVRRVAALVAVGAATTLTLALVVGAATSIGRTTSRVGDLAYAVTGSADAHREVLKMEVATRRTDSAALAQVEAQRGFAGQQLRLTLPGLVHRADPNPAVPQMLRGLALVDAAIAENERDGGPPSERLAASVTGLELDLKRVDDIEEQRYFGLNQKALDARTQSERLLVALAGVIFLAGAGSLISMRLAARANLRQKAEQLAEALADLEIAQADRGRLLDETVRASERERVRLAAELHDGPIQALAALCFRLDRIDSKLRKGDAAGAAPLVATTRDDLGAEVSQLRRFMSELRPPALDEDGLGGATRDYVNAFIERTGCIGTITVDVEEAAITPEREVVLYRLVQEALTNVARHADAARVAVVLRQTSDAVELTITDDGVGFDTSQTADFVRNSHFGLAGMRERVDAAGGVFTATSSPGAGVQIQARLPIASDQVEVPTHDELVPVGGRP